MVQDSNFQVELRFSSCVCVYSQQKMCPVHLYHRVYLVDRNLCKNIFSLACQEKFILDNSTILLVN